MASLEDFGKALIPESPIKRGRAMQMGLPGQKIFVTLDGSNISQQFTCATVVNSGEVTVMGDRVFCATAPITSLSRTTEYSRFRPIGVPVEYGKIKYLYSIISGSARQLYVGGYQKASKLVGTYPTSGVGGLIYAYIDNLGADRYEINTIVVSGSGGTTTYPGDAEPFLYGYSDLSFAKDGTVQQAFRFSTLLSIYSPLSSKGYGFYSTAVYKYFVNGIDMWLGGPDEYTTYSRTYFNEQRLVGVANVKNFSSLLIGTWDYVALPRNGTPLVLSNNNASNLNTSQYDTIRINQTGDRGIGIYTYPGYRDYLPVWFDDTGANVATGSAFNFNTDLYNQYSDVVGEQFYTFPKAALDITQDQALTVKTYDSTFTQVGETTVQTFKASTSLNGFTLHQASYNPN